MEAPVFRAGAARCVALRRAAPRVWVLLFALREVLCIGSRPPHMQSTPMPLTPRHPPVRRPTTPPPNTTGPRQQKARPHAAGVCADARRRAAGAGPGHHQHPGELGQNGPRRGSAAAGCRRQRHGRQHHEREHHARGRCVCRASAAPGGCRAVAAARATHTRAHARVCMHVDAARPRQVLRTGRSCRHATWRTSSPLRDGGRGSARRSTACRRGARLSARWPPTCLRSRWQWVWAAAAALVWQWVWSEDACGRSRRVYAGFAWAAAHTFDHTFL